MLIIVDLSLQAKVTKSSVNKDFGTTENSYSPMQRSSSLSWVTFSPGLDFTLYTWILNVFRFGFFIGDHNDIEPLILFATA